MREDQPIDLYRCPIDPKREATLVLDDSKLYCSRCRVQFPSKEGIPSFVLEDAILPEGCSRIEKLPCQKKERS